MNRHNHLIVLCSTVSIKLQCGQSRIVYLVCDMNNEIATDESIIIIIITQFRKSCVKETVVLYRTLMCSVQKGISQFIYSQCLLCVHNIQLNKLVSQYRFYSHIIFLLSALSVFFALFPLSIIIDGTIAYPYKLMIIMSQRDFSNQTQTVVERN